MNPIPEEKAFEICRKIRDERGVKLFSQCWGCVKFSKGDKKKMCFYNPPENRGCSLINKWLENQFEA